jgi:N-acetylneuraminic acid mutarotase
VVMSRSLFCVAVAMTLLALALCICSYSPAADGTWTQKADMPTARCMLSTCVLDGEVYAIAGITPNAEQFFSTVEVYNPGTDTWTKKADLPVPTNLENCASVVNGKIYAIGGTIKEEIGFRLYGSMIQRQING